MSRSEWQCKACQTTLGWVHGGSKAFRPAPGVTIIWHGICGTAICPSCDLPRVFSGYAMELRRVVN
jgi:hypothetical protein